MDNSHSPHSPLIQAIMSYAATSSEREACWDAVDTEVHPSVSHLVQSLRLSDKHDVAGARKELDAALQLLSEREDLDLYLAAVIVDAKQLAAEKGATSGAERLSSLEHVFEKTTPEVRMAAHWTLGIQFRTAGLLADSVRQMNAAKAEAVREEWQYDVALLTSELGSLYLESGDPVKAVGYYEDSYRQLDRMGHRQMADRVLMNLALTHGRIGEAETAEQLLEEAIGRQRDTVTFKRLAGGLLNLAALKKRVGKLDEAAAIYDEMLRRTVEEPPSMERVRALIGAASICNQKGENDAALEILDQARIVASEIDLAVTVLDIDSKRADVFRDAGQKDHAVNLLQSTFSALREHTHTQYTVGVGALLEQWLVEDNRLDEAYAVLKVCSDLQREVYKKESERALELSTVRQNMEAERRDLQLREEERRSLLHQVMPLSIAERVMAGERRIADRLDMVGILFADIVGFTQFAAGKSPSDVLEDLESLFQAVDELIGRHGCEKIKTIGDSYMATSGTDVQHSSEDPRQAVARLARCGLDMLDLLSRPEHAHVDLRIGMHAGPVVAGVMRGMRLAYDMWGDTVNIASRMESTSVAGRLQITKEVADLLQAMDEFVVTPREAITVRGRGEMNTFWLARP